MDNTPEVDVELPGAQVPLSYDETLPYSEQLEPTFKVVAEGSSAKGTLADRIGTNRVYLISDAALAARAGKVRRNHI